ncbi:hypothetical protein [Phormidium sp. FACHB-1136]|uniref:hypothetical protein n=1 Tax=Phormidium sp. FACHB-1136 TaxID=2692848 RepID=UPI0016820C15|nr:hypothetical protein [Phormidium sp. FACHB-1136]MBD2426505.1 hypothetical protein [Phormidium sp. FACHB-1136]
MNYSEAEQKLKKIFESQNYEILVQKGLRHEKHRLAYKCSNGSEIHISYPGLKTGFRYGKVVYDYRVDLVTPDFKVSLSHVNIIVDIYNKCLHGFDPEVMRKLLVEVAQRGQISFSEEAEVRDYSLRPVHKAILRRAEEVHAKLGKTYNPTANQKDLGFDELFNSIFWIVLQEDINYPMPRFQGRKMPFARYLEALHCFQDNKHKHKLGEVMKRALVEGRPPQDWSDMSYAFRDQIY